MDRMGRTLEVRVRTQVPPWLAGIAVMGLSLATAQAQATATPPASNTAPTTQSVPAPTPAEPEHDPGRASVWRPDFAGRDAGTAAAPQQAPPPVVTTEPPPPQTPYTAMPAYGPAATPEAPRMHTPGDRDGSAYIPVDSWVYPAMVRLYSMGYLDTMFLSTRPYTRRSALHILQQSEDAILSSDDEQAQDILAALLNELTDEGISSKTPRGTVYGVQSVYTRVQGISGPILQDSYHLGQTFFNDYGRPHEPGFNNVTGFSTLEEHGPFSLYVRGEYQHAPGGAGYSQALSAQLSAIDQIVPFAPPNYPQATIPTGPIAAQNPFRLVEATLSYHILGHEISGGKSDAWLGPGMGGAMAWSNNAENIYSFRINRVEPLNIKWLSKLVGPVRYDFFYGSLKGHTAPNNDYTHSEIVSFQPLRDFQFSLQRTIIFGGAGHEPVTLHVPEGLLRRQRHHRRGKILARRSGGAFLGLQLLLSAAVCAQEPDPVCGLGDA